MTGDVFVISYPQALTDGQADFVRAKAQETLGADVKVLVLDQGATMFRLPAASSAS